MHELSAVCALWERCVRLDALVCCARKFAKLALTFARPSFGKLDSSRQTGDKRPPHAVTALLQNAPLQCWYLRLADQGVPGMKGAL